MGETRLQDLTLYRHERVLRPFHSFLSTSSGESGAAADRAVSSTPARQYLVSAVSGRHPLAAMVQSPDPRMVDDRTATG